MKNFLLPLIVGLLVTVPGGYFLYQLTLKTPEVRFTLLDPVPVSFLSQTSAHEIVQQLEVKNVGNAKSEKIQVRIDGEIASYQLEKYSELDDVRVLNNNGVFELTYPVLPPQAGFKLTLKAVNSQLSLSNLKVFSDTGPALPALQSSDSSSLFWFYWVTIILFNLAQIFFWVAGARRVKETNMRTWRSKDLAEVKRPWYFTKSRWDEVIENTWKYRIAKDNLREGGLRPTDSYFLLSIDQQGVLESEEVWRELSYVAAKKLKEIYTGALRYATENEILKLLQEAKPQHLSEEDWNDLTREASIKYCEKVRRPTWDIEALKAALKREKPTQVDQATWNEMMKELRKTAVQHYEHEIAFRGLSYEQMKLIDLSDLGEESAKKLLQKAYRNQFEEYLSIRDEDDAKKFVVTPKPDDVTQADFERAKRQAERILAHHQRAEEQVAKAHESALESANAIAKAREAEAQSLKEITESRRLSEDVSLLKAKIMSQLQVIDQVLNDPHALMRIEEYADTFAPGNFENLKKLAGLIEKERTDSRS